MLTIFFLALLIAGGILLSVSEGARGVFFGLLTAGWALIYVVFIFALSFWWVFAIIALIHFSMKYW